MKGSGELLVVRRKRSSKHQILGFGMRRNTVSWKEMKRADYSPVHEDEGETRRRLTGGILAAALLVTLPLHVHEAHQILQSHGRLDGEGRRGVARARALDISLLQIMDSNPT